MHAGAMTIVPEGSMFGESCADLRSAVALAIQNGFQVELDLSGLRYVDADGLTVLSELHQSGVVVHSPSPFVSELLKQH